MPETPLTEEQMIGARIRQVRQQRDMSQAALAAKAGLSLPHSPKPMANAKRGSYDPDSASSVPAPRHGQTARHTQCA